MTSLWFSSGLYVKVYQGCFWHYIKHDKCCLSSQAYNCCRNYVSGEPRLSSSGSEWIWFLPTCAERRSRNMAIITESHFIRCLRVEGVKLPKTVDHWSLRNRSAALCLWRLVANNNVLLLCRHRFLKVKEHQEVLLAHALSSHQFQILVKSRKLTIWLVAFCLLTTFLHVYI